MKKIFGWLKESNRLKHLGFGFLIYFVMAFVGIVAVNIVVANAPIEYRQAMSLLMCWMALLCVGSSMASVEFIQDSIGGKWDWLDLLAGCLSPIVLNAIFTLAYVLI